jgi:outer membrane receptor protein involved in Fe transport
MPIGAQLPIKEAERIEIIYGAGSAIYGGDTNAGVINIITRQSQRPVFTQANLSVGQGLYSSVNVMFGGRLGKDKRIFNLFAYGSNVLLERRNTFYDEANNYNPLNYLGDTPNFRYMDSPNYAGTRTQPSLTNTPHLSRKFGISLNYKGITLSIESMYRRDHSAIGLNPVAVSYANPLTYTGEGIWRGNLNFFKDRPRMNSKWDITYLHYRLDNRSSVLFVENHLASVVFDAAGVEAWRLHGDSAMYYQGPIYQNAYNTLFAGLRYMYGLSDEIRIEHVRNFRLLKRISLTAGTNVRAAYGSPITYFVSKPVTTSDIELTDVVGEPIYNPAVFPVAPQQELAAEANAFGQLFYNWKSITLIAGVYASVYSQLDTAQTGLSPRFAGLWKLGEGLKLRASWGQSFRPPSLYYNAVSYAVTSDSLAHPIRSAASLGNMPEKTVSFEGGVRWQLGDFLLGDLTWFNNRTSNLLRYSLIQSTDINSTYYGYLGYESGTLAEAKVRGWQLHLRLSNLLPENWLEAQYNVTISKADDPLQTVEFDDVEERPSFKGQIHQLRLLAHPGKRIHFIFDGLWVRGIRDFTIDGQTRNRFFTLDAVARFAFNQQFSVYIKVINLLDKKYPGIRATGTPDDLLYNPQNGTFFRLGMNYSLE